MINYSVFTKKSITDLSYLACAKRIFEIESIYPKFATHNAHTVSAINYLGARIKSMSFKDCLEWESFYISALTRLINNYY
jgi:RHH-type proline utilization regulon transcriptional repressor/proline dehydrogenase/delta 1-pyrroline-5-carboxylate dehydrogenase